MKSLDFVTVDYGLIENTRLLIKSIEDTVDTTKYDYMINLVWQYDNTQERLKKDVREKNLIAEFGKKKNINLVEGCDQSDKTVNTSAECGNVLSWPSTYGYQGYQKGTLAGNREYVCYVDTDSFFVSKNWIDLYIEKADENFFSASRFDNGKHFRTKHRRDDIGMAWAHLFMIKRKNLKDNNLLPDCSWRDTNGNITLFAHKNDLSYYIFPMHASSYHSTCINHIKYNGRPDKKHKFLLDLNGDISISESGTFLHFHQQRGNRKTGSDYKRNIGQITDWYKEHYG